MGRYWRGSFIVNAFKINRVKGEDEVFAEFAADATVMSTGRRYHQDNLPCLRAECGKIVLPWNIRCARVVPAFSRDSAAEGAVDCPQSMVSAAPIGNIGRFPPQDHCRLTPAMRRVGSASETSVTSHHVSET